MVGTFVKLLLLSSISGQETILRVKRWDLPGWADLQRSDTDPLAASLPNTTESTVNEMTDAVESTTVFVNPSVDPSTQADSSEEIKIDAISDETTPEPEPEQTTTAGDTDSISSIDDNDTTVAPDVSTNTTDEVDADERAAALGPCKSGWWGRDCRNLCNCAEVIQKDGEKSNDGVPCRQRDGDCYPQPDGQKCKLGYKGVNCYKPHCVEDCGEFGICTSPNVCTCFGHYVAEEIDIVPHEITGSDAVLQRQCISQRAKGLKGCVAALIILIISISFCGCIQHTAEKRYERGQSYSYINNN